MEVNLFWWGCATLMIGWCDFYRTCSRIGSTEYPIFGVLALIAGPWIFIAALAEWVGILSALLAIVWGVLKGIALFLLTIFITSAFVDNKTV